MHDRRSEPTRFPSVQPASRYHDFCCPLTVISLSLSTYLTCSSVVYYITLRLTSCLNCTDLLGVGCQMTRTRHARDRGGNRGYCGS